ncbi:transposable element Tc1 transposase [Trichonephila clavipes]|nr:transposable element Tc1 transposase [Trichonephila clavipes]
MQWNCSAVMRVWKQWTDEHRTTRKNRQWTMEGDVSAQRSTPASHGGEELYSLLQAVGSPSVYCYRCTNVGLINSSMSAVPWIPCKYESRFNLRDHGGRIRARRYAGERYLPESVIERHSGLTLGVMVWGEISYPGRSNLLRIEGNLNSNMYVCEVLQREVVHFL